MDRELASRATQQAASARDEFQSNFIAKSATDSANIATKGPKTSSCATRSRGLRARTIVDPQSTFASGLSSLISQVSAGNAPTDLQAAFSKLASDLQASGATASATDAPSSSTSSTAQATLQAFLTNLQQDLGYGGPTASASGSLITTQV